MAFNKNQSSPAILTFTPNPINRRQRSRRDPCVYCGGEGSTKDHVVPSNLYVAENREELQLQTVSACVLCNGMKSLCDAPLRDFLAFDVDSSQHPDAKALIPQVERAVLSNRSRSFDRFYEGREIPFFDREGKFDSLGWEFPASSSNHISALDWITRGMHWVVFKERTKPESVKSVLIDRYKRHDLMLESAVKGGFQAFFKQGEQYACAYAHGAGGKVYWHHIFFDSVLFVSLSSRSLIG